jgi:hypothetical protein
VRHGPKGMSDGGTMELTEGGGENGTAAQRRCDGGSPVGRRRHEAEDRD